MKTETESYINNYTHTPKINNVNYNAHQECDCD